MKPIFLALTVLTLAACPPSVPVPVATASAGKLDEILAGATLVMATDPDPIVRSMHEVGILRKLSLLDQGMDLSNEAAVNQSP